MDKFGSPGLEQESICYNGFQSTFNVNSSGQATFDIGIHLEADRITKNEVESLLEKDIFECHERLEKAFPWIQQMPPVVGQVLSYLCFHLGWSHLRQLDKMLRALENEDWETASYEMRKSHWAQQAGQKAEDFVVKIENLQMDWAMRQGILQQMRFYLSRLECAGE